MGTGSYTMNENLEMLNRGGFDIKIRTLEKDYSYKTWLKGNLPSIKKEYADYKIKNEYEIETNGVPAICIYSVMTVNDVSLSSFQLYFTNEKTGYILSASAKTESFDLYQELFVEIAWTFKTINTKAGSKNS